MIPLADLLPHAAPMVLLSGYEPWTESDSVAAFVDVSTDSPFFDTELGGVPSCVALEYMAQTMALLVGLVRRRNGQAPQMGFVLGSRRLEIGVPRFSAGTRYRIAAKCTYQDESFGSFDCVLTDSHGALCAQGTLTAFQPDDEMTSEKLKDYE